jgi:ketosteroid isomerase-like protein
MSDNVPPSRENVERVKQIYDAFARRDIPEAFARFDAAIELKQSDEVPWGGTYNGHEGALQFFSNLTQTISSVVTVERYIDAGDSVVAIGWTRGTVNATGAKFDVSIAHVWTFRGGLAIRVRFFIDNPTMRAALAG